MTADQIYTRSERRDRKYTVGYALSSAQRVLKRVKGFRSGTCINAISGRQLSEKITLEEVNTLSRAIIDDSLYYGGHW